MEKKKKKSLDLTQGSIATVLILFVLPILAGSLIQQLYTTVDAVIVGRFVGKTGLAAIDSVGTLFKFPINFLSGLSAGATIVVSKLFGEKNDEELDCAIHTGYTIAIVLGILCSVVGVLFAPQLLQIMSVPEDIRGITLIYCRIYFAGLWTMTLYNMVAGILRAFGDSKSPLYILIACCVINIAGDIVLVGVFHLGVAGAAIATIAAQLISALLAMRLLSKAHGHDCEEEHCHEEGHDHEHCHRSVWQLIFCKEHMLQMVSIGIPLAFQGILFPIANSIVQASINTMGTDTIAAWAVCNKLDLFIWLVADAMSPALSTYVAQNMGAQKHKRVFQGVMLGAFISFATVGLISLALFVAPGPLGSLFVTKTDAGVIIPLVIHYMKMMAPFYVFYAFAEAFSGACCGLGDTVKPMIVTLCCTCLLRVIAIFFILPMFGTMDCIVYIYIASWIATGVSFITMFLIKNRKLNKAMA
ncbi:MAG: MATE family efflux transporter [Eubacteriales bacterium]|nr:MATE family efflux transporter [Eubacteriales bacterium]